MSQGKKMYGRDASEREKQKKAAEWLSHLWCTRSGRLSTQVLHEFYVTVTQKLKPGKTRAAARREVRALLTWDPIPPDAALLEEARDLQDRHGLSWWDALIVAGAQSAGCRYLLSEDFQDGRVFGDVRVLNPFLHDVEETR